MGGGAHISIASLPRSPLRTGNKLVRGSRGTIWGTCGGYLYNNTNNWLQPPLERIIRMVRLFPLGLCCGPGLYGNGTCPNHFVGQTLLFHLRCDVYGL